MRRSFGRPELCGVYTFSRDRAQWRTVYAETLVGGPLVRGPPVSESGREVFGLADSGPRTAEYSESELLAGRQERDGFADALLSPTGGWVDPLRTVSSCHQDQCWRRSPVDGAAPRPRPPAPGVQSGFAISLLHRSQSAASSLTFSGCAAARSFFSPRSSARLKS